ncbi:MAG TPA: TonB-dependent receptor, partial [Sphingomonadaceae bacterium]|nr:TonB-dependent receptor [Sphingomonadaceae bacterium]
IAVLPAPGVVDLGGRANFENVSYRAGLEYDAASTSMLFATVATGYKAGGFFSAAGPDNSYRPEKLTAFTLGARNRFLDGRLQVNVEGFYWKYDDKQERYLGASTTTGSVSLLTTNAGKATLYGGNLDIVFKPSRADQFNIAVEYLHTKYDSFAYTVYDPPPFGTAFGYGAQATSCALGPIVPFTPSPAPTDATQRIDCSGKPLIRAPKWTGTVAYQHGFDLASGAQIVPAIESQFASSQYLYPDFVSSGRDNGFVTLNADITYRSPGDHVTVTLWGKNLTRQAIYTGGIRYSFSAPVAPQGDPTLFYANIRPPRTYGVTLRAKY